MKVAAEAGRLKREGLDVVDFSAGEPDFPTPKNIKDAAIDALNKNFTKYTPISGTPELKQAICNFHKDAYATTYKPNECIVTVGGKPRDLQSDPSAAESRRRMHHSGAVLGDL